MNAEQKHLDILYKWTRYQSWFDLESVLIAHGYRRIAIYGGALLGALAYESLAEGAVQVAGVIDHNAALQFPYPVKTVTPDRAAALGPVDAVLIACLNIKPIEEALMRLAVPARAFVDLNELIMDIEDLTLLETTLQHVASQGARLLLCDLTNPLYHKNPSLFETAARSIEQFDWLKASPRCLAAYYDDLRDLPEDYAKTMMQMTLQAAVVKQDGVAQLADVQSPYYNVVDHCRLTAGTPERYDHTIHFFGNCAAVGCFAEDRYTIESRLQQRLCEKPPRGAVFRVINRANWMNGAGAFRSVLRERFCPGDYAVLLCGGLHRFTYYFKNLRYHDLTTAFDRPHRYGGKEIFFDRYHTNHRGYDLLAEYLYNILLFEEDVVQGETVSPHFSAKLRLRPWAGSAPGAPKDTR